MTLIHKLNQILKLSDILFQKQEWNNEMKLTLKYLSLKLLGTGVNMLETVLSSIENLKRKHANDRDADTNQYRVFLPKIEDVREFSKRQSV